MKVHPTLPPTQVKGAELGPRASPKASGKEPAAKVSLSSDAEFVSALQKEAADTPEIREDVVAETRAAIEDGSFEDSVDMEAVIDSLLADL